jgi:ABC-type molybdate transport system substrate-binding protein
MDARVHPPARLDLDELMRHLMILGFVALALWAATGLLGVVSGYVSINPSATLRFLLAILILVFARRTYWELREWRWKRLPPDERYGFANPLSDPSPGSGFSGVAVSEDDLTVATGSSPTQR